MNDCQLATLCRTVREIDSGLTVIKDGAEIQACYVLDIRVLVFMATDTRRDWLRNIWAFKDNGVHMGFRAAWTAIDGEVFKAVGDDDGITIVGHSLGGALAQQAFMALPSGSVSQVITFGQPALYGNAMADAYSAKAEGTRQMRYVFWDDPVPWTPFLHWGFKHPVPATYLRWWPTHWRPSVRHYIERYENGKGYEKREWRVEAQHRKGLR